MSIAAFVAGYEHQNKDGSRDKRFKDNATFYKQELRREVCFCRMGYLEMQINGVDFKLVLSNTHALDDIPEDNGKAEWLPFTLSNKRTFALPCFPSAEEIKLLEACIEAGGGDVFPDDYRTINVPGHSASMHPVANVLFHCIMAIEISGDNDFAAMLDGMKAMFRKNWPDLYGPMIENADKDAFLKTALRDRNSMLSRFMELPTEEAEDVEAPPETQKPKATRPQRKGKAIEGAAAKDGNATFALRNGRQLSLPLMPDGEELFLLEKLDIGNEYKTVDVLGYSASLHPVELALFDLIWGYKFRGNEEMYPECFTAQVLFCKNWPTHYVHMVSVDREAFWAQVAKGEET